MPNFRIVHKLTEIECLRWRLLLADRARLDAEVRAMGFEFGAKPNEAIAPHGDGYAILQPVAAEPADAPSSPAGGS